MHDGKAVTFAQHFLKIGELVTVQVRMVLPTPFAAGFGPGLPIRGAAASRQLFGVHRPWR